MPYIITFLYVCHKSNSMENEPEHTHIPKEVDSFELPLLLIITILLCVHVYKHRYGCICRRISLCILCDVCVYIWALFSSPPISLNFMLFIYTYIFICFHIFISTCECVCASNSMPILKNYKCIAFSLFCFRSYKSFSFFLAFSLSLARFRFLSLFHFTHKSISTHYGHIFYGRFYKCFVFFS